MMRIRPEQTRALGGAAPCRIVPPEPRTTPTGPVRAGPPGPSVEVVNPAKPSFINIELVTRDGRPVAGAEYRVILPDGTTCTGRLDEAGRCLIEGIDHGDCTIMFPGFDHRDFVSG